MILMSFANVFYGIFCIFKQIIPESIYEKALLLGCFAHTWFMVKRQDVFEHFGLAPKAQVSAVYEVFSDHKIKPLRLADIAYRNFKPDSNPEESLRIIVLYRIATLDHSYAIMYHPGQLHQVPLLIPYSLEEIQQYRQKECTIFPYADISLEGRDITSHVCQYAGPKQNFHDDIACAAFAGDLMIDFDKLEVITGDSLRVTGIDLAQYSTTLKDLGANSQGAEPSSKEKQT